MRPSLPSAVKQHRKALSADLLPKPDGFLSKELFIAECGITNLRQLVVQPHTPLFCDRL